VAQLEPHAWTDGDTLLLALSDADQSGLAWIAFCLQTGETLWHADRDETQELPQPSRCVAVAGRLLCMRGNTVVRIG